MRRIITAAESIADQKRQHPYFKPEVTPEISMIVPGRRALGETWTRVTIGHDADRITVDTAPAEAPADNIPIMAVTGPDAEYAKYILDAQLEKARDRAGQPPRGLTRQEKYDLVNEAWFAFMEQKQLHLMGRSTFGAGINVERQRIVQNPDTRPLMRKE